MRYIYKPEPAPPGALAELLGAVLVAVILAAPFAYYFWSMKS